MVKELTASEKMVKARANLILDQPFFGAIALQLELKEEACKDCVGWTDGRVLAYDPGKIVSMSLPRVKTFVAHEVMHVANMHHIRRDGRDGEQWNKACDLTVNYTLRENGFDVPDNWIIGSEDKAAEEYYKESASSDDGDGDNGSGDSDSMPGEVRDLPSEDGDGTATEAEINTAEAEAKVMIAQSLQYAKSQGLSPVGMERVIADTLEPELNWREILQKFVGAYARNDYAWIPPNRRFIQHGLYLPSCRSEEIDRIVIGIDTSGSITQGMLDAFASELNEVLEQYDTTLTIIYCDSQVYKDSVQDCGRDDMPLALEPIGGGGTSFIPVFDYVQAQALDVTCLIYFTDMYGRFPGSEPDYPVLWVSTSRIDKAPFGEVVRFE